MGAREFALFAPTLTKIRLQASRLTTSHSVVTIVCRTWPRYQKRWFVLHHCKLAYYKHKKDDEPLGVVLGESATVSGLSCDG